MREGDGRPLDRLVPLLYDELHQLAHRELRRRGGAATLKTTGLVHEAYLKLIDQTRIEVQDRGHFLALAATAMRHIVIDRARSRQTLKRGGDWRRVTFDEDALAADPRPEALLALDEALDRLERFDQRLCRVVECRFFAGLTVAETAAALEVSPRTVDRAWQKAKAWLYLEIQ